jgi:hypothetical protein
MQRAQDNALKHGEDARAVEREHLKLALATFALQLDAFEMRTQSVLLSFGKPANPIRPPDSGRWSRKDRGSEG